VGHRLTASNGRYTDNWAILPKIASTFSPFRQYTLTERMKTFALLVTATGMEAPDDCSRTLASAQAGDLTAFERLMRQHERLVLATAFRLLGNVEDAQDVAQEVFLKLYRNLKKMETEQNFTGWLYRVTVNLCRDHQHRRPVTVELPDLPASPSGPHQQLAESERRQVLEMSLRRLSEKERAALVMRDLEGLSTIEVARILGSSEATVRSQISHARVKVKEFVERYFGGKP
jgi:RNA polymerase sigma-70 factor, ECF subfamily